MKVSKKRIPNQSRRVLQTVTRTRPQTRSDGGLSKASSSSAPKFVALLSGGLDSVSTLYFYLESQLSPKRKNLKRSLQNLISANFSDSSRSQEGVALFIDYGQKASLREEQVARFHAKKLGLNFIKLKTQLFSKYGKSALTQKNHHLPKNKELNIESLEVSTRSASRVWVPNRNGVFLNLAAFYAEALGANKVLIGFNKEEAQTFPDNTLAFLKKAEEFFSFSTANQVKVISPTVSLEKPEIVKKLMKLKKNSAAHLWPCYEGFDTWCGECESCLRSKRAFEANGLNWEKLRNENKEFIKKISLHRR